MTAPEPSSVSSERPTPERLEECSLIDWQQTYGGLWQAHCGCGWKGPVGGSSFAGETAFQQHLLESARKADREALAVELLEAINAEAEADMLAGNPVTGAHHRAIERRLAAARAAMQGIEG